MRSPCRGSFVFPLLFPLLFLLIFLEISVFSAAPIANATASVTSNLSDSSLTNCDGVGTLSCPPATLRTGDDGYTGCPSVSSCAAYPICIPQTPGSDQPCNANNGGCMICSTAMPTHMTITNANNGQNVTHCGQQSTVETISCSNIIASGSMALLTSQTKPSMAMATAKNVVPFRNVAADAFIPTDGKPIDSPGGTMTITAGAIAIGAAVGFMVTWCGIMRILNTRRHEQRSIFRFLSQNSRHRPVELTDNSRLTTASSANQPAPHMDLESQVSDPRANHPAFASNRRTMHSTRWSTNNAPDLGSEESIDQMFERLFSMDELRPAPVQKPYESVDSFVISPNTNNDTTLAGGVTRPAYTYSIQHFERKIRRSSHAARCESPPFENSSTTVTATGSGSNNTAPETALANGSTGGSAEDAAEQTGPHEETAAAQETGNAKAVSQVETAHDDTA